MKLMTSPTIETVDLFDLKLLPAWVKEPAEAKGYAHYTGEEETGLRKAGHGPQRGKPKRRTPINREQASNIQRPTRKADRPHREASRNKTGSTTGRWHGAKHRPSPNRDAPVMRTPPVTIRFLPYLPAFENVVAQIQSGSVAYSLFALRSEERRVGKECRSRWSQDH